MRLVLVALMAAPVFCQPAQVGKDLANILNDKWLAGSLTAQLSASVIDAGTSRYLIDMRHLGYEVNPAINALNRGDQAKFGLVGVGVKMSVFAGIVAGEALVLRQTGNNRVIRRTFIALNFGLAGFYTGLDIRNVSYIRSHPR